MKLKVKQKNLILWILLFLAILTVYYITSPGPTPYDYFVRLADAFLDGKLWLTENPSWLNELIPWQGGRFYVINPPAPAILLMPAVAIFGADIPQQYLAHLLGALSVVTFAIIAYRISRSYAMVIWVFLLCGVGNIMWFLASQGSVWYLGQLAAVFFHALAMAEVYGRRRLWLIGLFVAFAVLSRQQNLFSLPLYIYLLRHDLKQWRHMLVFGLSLLPAIAGIPIYNLIRFGSPFETGYQYIPGLLSEPWFYDGVFSLKYIPTHLEIMFLALPDWLGPPRYFQPSWGGMAIWATTPAFLYALWAPIKNHTVKLVWLTIALIGLLNFSFGSTGFIQFGYRYAVDFYPFLILLTILGVWRLGLKWHNWVLLGFSIVVNSWGVIWINFFDWGGW